MRAHACLPGRFSVPSRQHLHIFPLAPGAWKVALTSVLSLFQQTSTAGCKNSAGPCTPWMKLPLSLSPVGSSSPPEALALCFWSQKFHEGCMLLLCTVQLFCAGTLVSSQQKHLVGALEWWLQSPGTPASQSQTSPVQASLVPNPQVTQIVAFLWRVRSRQACLPGSLFCLTSFALLVVEVAQKLASKHLPGSGSSWLAGTQHLVEFSLFLRTILIHKTSIHLRFLFFPLLKTLSTALKCWCPR